MPLGAAAHCTAGSPKTTFTTAKCQNNLYAEELILSFTQCLRLHPIFRRSPNCDLFNSTDHRVLGMWQSVRSQYATNSISLAIVHFVSASMWFMWCNTSKNSAPQWRNNLLIIKKLILWISGATKCTPNEITCIFLRWLCVRHQSDTLRKIPIRCVLLLQRLLRVGLSDRTAHCTDLHRFHSMAI